MSASIEKSPHCITKLDTYLVSIRIRQRFDQASPISVPSGFPFAKFTVTNSRRLVARLVHLLRLSHVAMPGWVAIDYINHMPCLVDPEIQVRNVTSQLVYRKSGSVQKNSGEWSNDFIQICEGKSPLSMILSRTRILRHSDHASRSTLTTGSKMIFLIAFGLVTLVPQPGVLHVLRSGSAQKSSIACLK